MNFKGLETSVGRLESQNRRDRPSGHRSQNTKQKRSIATFIKGLIKIQKATNTVHCGLHAFDDTLFDRLVLRSDSGGEGSNGHKNSKSNDYESLLPE